MANASIDLVLQFVEAHQMGYALRLFPDRLAIGQSGVLVETSAKEIGIEHFGAHDLLRRRVAGNPPGAAGN
jgi:hypothetical protein